MPDAPGTKVIRSVDETTTTQYVGVPKPENVTLGDAGVWVGAAFAFAVFVALCWRGLNWAVKTINSPVQEEVRQQALRIQHLENDQKSIKDDVKALSEKIDDGFRDMRADQQKAMDRLGDQIGTLTTHLMQHPKK